MRAGRESITAKTATFARCAAMTDAKRAGKGKNVLEKSKFEKI